MLLLLVPVLWLHQRTGAAPSGSSEPLDAGADWLSRFGYLPPPDPVTGQLQTQEALTRAIRAMQRFGGLKETGIFDQDTLLLMGTPRCSLPDVPEGLAGRSRRGLTPQNKWKKRHLTWRVRSFPRDSPSLGRDTVRALMHYALKVWSDVAPLDFHEVAGSGADIQIDFTKADHDDGYPFDGPGGTVAHAFFPGEKLAAGDTHFDDDEAWTFRAPDAEGMDLFAVAVHEFGHALGLVHTSAVESIMRPYYQGPVGDPLKYELPYEDKVRLWQLYGVRDSVSHTTGPGGPSQTAEPPVLLDLPDNRSTLQWSPDTVDRCSSHFDAVAQIRGEAFFFKGRFFWRVTREKQLVALRPALLQAFWRGLPPSLDGVDAVYERPADHKIVFFKGSSYWLFADTILEEGFPRPISDFGLPLEGVDAAFVWLHNHKTYFFKERRYWRYDEQRRQMDPGYPKDSALWEGLPPHLDAAMSWSDGASYFFKGRDYWRVPGGGVEAEPGFPRLTSTDWLLCSQMLSDSPDSRTTAATGGARRQPDHAHDGYEVCSCTSDSAPLWGVSLLLLASLWTLRLVVQTEA